MDRWGPAIVVVIAIVGTVAYAGPKGKIRRYGHEPWTLVLGILVLLFAYAFMWATRR